MNEEINYGPYKLILTCGGCPEQYDVFDDSNNKVAYLRLRHGRFRCDVPDVFGTTIYESTPEGDGMFTDQERPIELQRAVDSIIEFYSSNEINQVWEKYCEKHSNLINKYYIMHEPRWPKVGSKITFKGVHLFWYTNIIQDANDLLELGKEYTVSKLELASSWCGVRLEEIPDKLFALSFFEYPKELILTTEEQYVTKDRMPIQNIVR